MRGVFFARGTDCLLHYVITCCYWSNALAIAAGGNLLLISVYMSLTIVKF